MPKCSKFTEFYKGLGGVLEHEVDEDLLTMHLSFPSKYSEKKSRVGTMLL